MVRDVLVDGMRLPDRLQSSITIRPPGTHGRAFRGRRFSVDSY
jgi:hypothetical protein